VARAKYGDQNGKDRKDARQLPLMGGYDAKFVGYVNYTPSADEKAVFDEWCDSASFWETLHASVEDGVNLSLKVDAKNSCYVASGTQRREASPNAGQVVTARASEPHKALARLLFILAILGRKESWSATAPVNDPDRW